MKGSCIAGLLLGGLLLSACAIDSREGEPAESTSTEVGSLTSAEAYGAMTYGGGTAMVRWRGGGSVESCTAGPMGVLLPNRFVSCACDQLVKDCGTDTTCTTCSNSRRQRCAQTRWFSSPSYLFGDCNVRELDACTAYCQQNCGASCVNEWIPN